MTAKQITAEILDTDGETFVAVDLRDLPADKLVALRDEAGVAGDSDLVAAIDAIQQCRHEAS